MARTHAERAAALVGTVFRPQGRGTDGLDCIGLALRVFQLPEAAARSDYRLRGDYRHEVLQQTECHFRRVSHEKSQPGDLLLLAPSDDQVHFAILTENGFVHAHAGLRRVVETPGKPEWPLIGAFRRRGKRGIK